MNMRESYNKIYVTRKITKYISMSSSDLLEIQNM